MVNGRISLSRSAVSNSHDHDQHDQPGTAVRAVHMKNEINNKSKGIQKHTCTVLCLSLLLSLQPREQVLKELSTKRIGFDKAAFVQTSADLLPVLCQAWDAQWAVIEGLLPLVAAGTVPSAESEAGAKAAEAMSLGTVSVKVG